MNTRNRAFGIVLMALAVAAPGPAVRAHDAPPLSVRITSPLGRTGVAGAIRIVAQVKAAPEVVLQPLKFFVNGELVGSDTDGPPYATEWVDANPFERSEVAVSVADTAGNVARDTVVLDPFEVTETSEVTSVLVEATVQDRDGRFVRGLGPGTFQVREDGVVQAIDLVHHEELPVTLALLIDTSQSMSRRMSFVQRTASRLVDGLRPKDRMLVVPFSRDLQAITGPTDDRDTVLQAIAATESKGGTAILDSLIATTTQFEGFDGRRAIVLITDGYDEHSENRFEDALAAVKEARTTVYVVGIGGVAGISLKGERFLRRLAHETGGRAFLPSRDEELHQINDTLADDVHNRYLLTYTPENQRADGSWRVISVVTSDPALVVRARPGYYAPKPPPVRPTIEFTITDTGDRFLDVSLEDLVVVENGVVQTADTFQEASSPVFIVLALDASGSMKKDAEIAKEAALRFAEALRPEDKVSLLMFADTPRFAHDLATDRQWTVQALREYEARGGTALYDAMAEAALRLKTVEGRRVIVVVTDGRDEDNPGKGPGSVRSFQDALREAHEADALVFAIGVGAKADRVVLETFASRSGGQVFFPDDASALGREYRRVVEHLRRRWVLSYTSTDSTRNGKWRKVEIRTRYPHAVVHSAGGYFAPEK